MSTIDIDGKIAHNLVYDEKIVKRFYMEYIDKYLYSEYCKILLLISPIKYRKDFSLNNDILKRELLTKKTNGNSPATFLKCVKSCEYTKDGLLDLSGRELDTDTLAIYVTMNQSSYMDAISNMNAHLQNALYDSLRNQWNEHSDQKIQSFQEILYDYLYHNASRVLLWDININIKDEFYVNEIMSIIRRRIRKSSSIKSVIETKNGYRVIIRVSALNRRDRTRLKEILKESQYIKTITNVYGESKTINVFDISSNSLIPVPGTVQCGFKVRFRDDLIQPIKNTNTNTKNTDNEKEEKGIKKQKTDEEDKEKEEDVEGNKDSKTIVY